MDLELAALTAIVMVFVSVGSPLPRLKLTGSRLADLYPATCAQASYDEASYYFTLAGQGLVPFAAREAEDHQIEPHGQCPIQSLPTSMPDT